MGKQRPFSKLKKIINGLFDEKLKIDFCCTAYPMRAQYANNHTPRFYVKMGKEIIVSLRLSAGKALDLNGRVTGYIVEFLALAK